MLLRWKTLAGATPRFAQLYDCKRHWRRPKQSRKRPCGINMTSPRCYAHHEAYPCLAKGMESIHKMVRRMPGRLRIDIRTIELYGLNHPGEWGLPSSDSTAHEQPNRGRPECFAVREGPSLHARVRVLPYSRFTQSCIYHTVKNSGTLIDLMCDNSIPSNHQPRGITSITKSDRFNSYLKQFKSWVSASRHRCLLQLE